MENKTLYNASTTLTIERSERDKDTSEPQLRNHQSLYKETANLTSKSLQIKIGQLSVSDCSAQ